MIIPSENALKLSNSSVPITLFCSEVYNEDNWFRLIVAHLVILSSLVIGMCMLFRFNRKKHYFPIRERAPSVAILQCFTYLFLIFLLYIVENGLHFKLIEWKTTHENSSDIEIGRRLMKSVYLSIRINIYIIFLIR